MPTIIDSLVVMLGLDPKPYEEGAARVEESLDELGEKSDSVQDKMDKGGQKTRAGMKETGNEADRTGRKVEDGGRRGAEGLDAMTKQAAKFLALIGGTVALKRFIDQTITSGAALDRFARNINQDVTTVSAWANEVEAGGGTAEGLVATLDMLSRAQTELQLTGESGLIPYLSALGISLADVGGKAKAPTQILLDLADRFSRMNRTQANNMGRMLGIDQGTLNLLLRGREEVELLIRRQEEFNALSAEQAEQASHVQRTIIQGGQAFRAFGRDLLSSAAPALETVFGYLARIGEWVRDNSEFVGKFLTTLAVGLGAIGAAAITLNPVALAITAVAGALALLWEDYEKWKNGGDAAMPWDKWVPNIKIAVGWLDTLRQKASDILYRGMAWVDAIAALAAGDKEAADRAFSEFDRGRPPEAPSTPAPPATVITPDDKAMFQARAMEYFVQQGWTPEQAAGIVANIKRESGFDYTAIGDNGNAVGLAQWHPERQQEFQNKFGKPLQGSSFEDQLAFIQYELTLGREADAGRALAGARNAEDAGGIVSRQYERPADADFEAAIRSLISQEILNAMKAAAQPATATGQSAGVPLGFVPGAAMGAGVPPREVSSNTHTTEVHIGEIKVSTAATDADGIARDLGHSLNYLFTSQANGGMVS